MGSCNQSSQLQSYKQLPRYTSLRIMSLWKVMTMSQAARQGAQAYEAHAAGRFVWGKEGFKWMSDDKSNCSQDKSTESLPSSGEQSQLMTGTGHQTSTGGLQGYQPQPSW